MQPMWVSRTSDGKLVHIFPHKAFHLHTHLLLPIFNRLLPHFCCFPSVSPGTCFMENVPAHVHIRPVEEPGGSLIPTVLFQSEYSSSNHSFPVPHFTKHLLIQYLDFEPPNHLRGSVVKYYYSISISEQKLAPKGNLPNIKEGIYEKTRGRPGSQVQFSFSNTL